MAMNEDLSVQLWKQQRRGTIGCGLLALVLAGAPLALLFLFAPIWAFWLALVPLGLFALLMLRSTVRELRKASIYLHEHSGAWQTGVPRKRSLDEIQSVWLDLQGRQQMLVEVTLRALELGARDPRLLGDVVVALEESGSAERGYWANVTALNHYEAEMRTLRTMVRSLMPASPPAGHALELMEDWLSQVIEETEAFRRLHVLEVPEGEKAFVDELSAVLDRHRPPSSVQKALGSQQETEDQAPRPDPDKQSVASGEGMQPALEDQWQAFLKAKKNRTQGQEPRERG